MLDRRLRRGALNGHAGRDRAGETDPLDGGMAGDGVAGRQAEAGHDVDGAARKQVATDLGQDAGRERALLRRLEDHRIAGHQRRRQRVGGELDRMIERNDPPDQSVRLAQGEMQVRGARRDRLAFDLEAEARVVVERIAGRGHVAAHLGDGVAGIDDLDLEQFVGAGADRLGETTQPRWRARAATAPPSRAPPSAPTRPPAPRRPRRPPECCR